VCTCGRRATTGSRCASERLLRHAVDADRLEADAPRERLVGGGGPGARAAVAVVEAARQGEAGEDVQVRREAVADGRLGLGGQVCQRRSSASASAANEYQR
jgi:hypothetical protein